MDAQGISAAELAEELGISVDGVYQQLTRPSPRASTVKRYSEALTRVLAGRGDPRFFTPESLRVGPEPQTPDEAARVEQLRAALEHELAGQYTDPQQRQEKTAELRDVLAVMAGALARHGADIEILPLQAAQASPTPDDCEPWVLLRRGGKVPCRFPMRIGKDEPALLAVPRSLLGDTAIPEQSLLVEVADGSLAGEGLASGDRLLIERRALPADGQLVLAEVGGLVAVRRLRQAGHQWVLWPPGRESSPLVVDDLSSLRLLGTVVWVLPRGWAPS